jgi:hypothetical protein|nr:MAG TPA: Protein of unknown function (DUF3307) [Caudoviricetes sp.]
MNTASTLLLMIFLHIVDDYYLQGILANMKQKQWWQDNAPASLYRYDYIVALMMHSMSWAFMIMLPIAMRMSFDVNELFVGVWIVNAIIHGVVDDLKANKHKINLIQDQSTHIIQIVLTAIIFMR